MKDQVTVLDIQFSFAGKEDAIHPAVLADDTHMILADCGYTGFMAQIERAMAEKGLDCSRLTHILITHHDHDHMGSLRDFKNKYPSICIVSSVIEEPYISGKIKSLRLEQAEQLQQLLPEEQKQFGIDFISILEKVQPAGVDMTVRDGDVLDWCGGCRVIDTSGHTPGHISLYLEKHRVLIAGDAAVAEKGLLKIANPGFALDVKKAEASLMKIQELGAKEIVCYHGGVILTEKE